MNSARCRHARPSRSADDGGVGLDPPDLALYGVIRGVRAFVPHLRTRGRGWVVNFASVAGLYAYAWDTIPYITAKFGVVGLTESLALYLRPLGIGVSLLCQVSSARTWATPRGLCGPDPEPGSRRCRSATRWSRRCRRAVADAIRDGRFPRAHASEARERMGREICRPRRVRRARSIASPRHRTSRLLPVRSVRRASVQPT